MDQVQIRQFISSHFSLEELRTFCFDLSISFDNLGGEGLDAKARELVGHCARNGRLSELEEALRRARPNMLKIERSNGNSALATMIQESASRNLKRHQEVLIPLFKKLPEPESIGDKFREVFMMQQERNNFGEWRSLLSDAIASEDRVEVRSQLQRLASLVDELYETYYSLKSNLPERVTKALMNSTFESTGDLEKLRSVATQFLEDQRRIVEDLGGVIGHLKALDSY